MVAGRTAFAAGYRAKANHWGSFVWGDSTDADFASTGNNQFLIRATGGVGINTASPRSQLEVLQLSSGGSVGIMGDTGPKVGACSVVARYGTSGVESGLELGGSPGGTNGAWISLGGAGRGDDMNSAIALSTGSPLAERMRVTAVGNVGIGTASPTAKLDVAGPVKATGFTGSGAGLTGISGAALADGSVAGSKLAPGDVGLTSLNTASVDTRYVKKAGDTMTGTLAVPANGLQAGGSQLVLASGYVGIGEVSPGERLVVGQGGNIALKASTDDAGDIVFQTSTGTQKGRVYTAPAAGQNKLHLSSGDNNPDITIGTNGYVGIATENPQSALHVNGSLQLDKTAGGPGRLILNTVSRNDGGRYGILFSNNAAAPFLGDDTQPITFSFRSSFSEYRTNDATVSVYGKASGTWGNYLGLTHNGTNGLITTDVGDLLLAPAGKVGIGTNNPQSALHVAGTITAYGVNTPPATVIPVLGMVWIQPGTFIMGSRADEPGRYSNEGPQTVVTLTRGFWMGNHEVTQAEYLKVIGSNPSDFTGDTNRPVERVTWHNATNYCGLLTQAERTAGRIPSNWGYRLPTEAEWEYACRAGARTTRYGYGDDLSYAALGNYAWYSANSGSTTHPVEQKLANPWGLMDMHGNVAEWCQDCDGTYPGGSVTDPQGPGTGLFRVYRGGSWLYGGYCRSAFRDSNYPSGAYSDVGFRVVLAPVQP